VKLSKKFGEEGEIAVGNVRRDILEQLKKAEKAEHFQRTRGSGEKPKSRR